MNDEQWQYLGYEWKVFEERKKMRINLGLIDPDDIYGSQNKLNFNEIHN